MKKYLVLFLAIFCFLGQAWAIPPMPSIPGGDMYADGTVPFTGNVVAPAFVGNTAANAAGERGYTANAFSWFANSEDLVLTATANTWTFSSTTLAATMSFGSMAVTAGSFTATAAADPTMTLSDSDNAAGTGKLYANSSGGANDIILYIGVEDSAGESTHYVEIDGVSETVDFLKPVVIPSLTLGATALSDNGVSLITAADYAAMKTLLDLEIGTDVQAYDAQLDAVSTGGANNTVFGINNAGAYGYYANHSHDDSAAQFTSATASKGTRKLVQSSISDGILLTDTPVVTGNATITTPSLGAGTYTKVFAETANTIGNGGTTNQKLVIREDTTDGAWTGIGLYRTCLAATAIGAPVYIDSAGKAVAANAAAAATMPAIGINVTTTAEANQACYIVTHGTVTQNTWAWTAGNTIYVDDSAAGVLTATIGDVAGTDHVVQIIGIALSDDTILVAPTLATITLE